MQKARLPETKNAYCTPSTDSNKIWEYLWYSMTSWVKTVNWNVVMQHTSGTNIMLRYRVKKWSIDCVRCRYANVNENDSGEQLVAQRVDIERDMQCEQRDRGENLKNSNLFQQSQNVQWNHDSWIVRVVLHKLESIIGRPEEVNTWRQRWLVNAHICRHFANFPLCKTLLNLPPFGFRCQSDSPPCGTRPVCTPPAWLQLQPRSLLSHPLARDSRHPAFIIKLCPIHCLSPHPTHQTTIWVLYPHASLSFSLSLSLYHARPSRTTSVFVPAVSFYFPSSLVCIPHPSLLSIMCVEICPKCQKAILVPCTVESHKDQRMHWKGVRSGYKCKCSTTTTIAKSTSSSQSTSKTTSRSGRA